MTRRRTLAVAAGAGAVLALALASLIEVVPTEVEVGPQGEARRDPHLAARRLLAELGVPAESRRALQPLPPAGHVLVLLAPDGALTGRDAERLLAWVEAGGRLVATPQRALAEPLGARVEETEHPFTGILPVAPGPGLAYTVEIDTSLSLSDPGGGAEWTSTTGPEGIGLLLRYRRGEGVVTLLSDLAFLENHRIGEHQHAALFWHLVRSEGQPPGVRLIGSLDYPSLSALLLRRGWPALAAGGALLALWAWRRAARFGPPLPDPPAGRRRLLEHVRAAGDFLWRQGRGEDLVASTRRGLGRAAARLHPGWERLDERERVARLARAAGLAGGAVSWALAGEVPADSAGFARMIQTLEKVRRAL